MAKSLAHISLLALLLNSEPHREALLRVLTAAQVPKGTPLGRIEETINSIFSSTISFSDDELPSEGCAHFQALHIVCKCNNHIVGRVMIDNGSALNVCPVTTLKQMNVDLNRIRPSKTAVRAFDGSRREVNGEIDLLMDIGPCSFSVTFQVLDIPNAFSLLLGRPWIHSASAIPSSLHQKVKFIVEEKIITVKGEEDYAIYKETAVPYISVGDDENPPFHSFETISVIRDYGEVGLHSNPNLRRVDSNPSEACLGEPGPIYFGEGLDEDSLALEIEESLRRLEDRQLTSLEPTEEINVGTKEEPRVLKIGTSLDPTQRVRMIDFLTKYQEVFAWSYADMPGLDPSIYVSRTSVKGQAIADHLAEFPIEDHTLINPDFPDEGILQVDDEGEKPGWKMYFDGAVNSMGSGISAVLISPDGRYYPVAAKIDFPCTNNVAEYEACTSSD
ncbi:hypothetical protein CRG98_026293 [Punica granatum]|uniref:Uncharacterized protein n=1 Tax=Punica granatum TaxID=22663 RepID=A0A2I0JCC5_PUNGR|nr:hypothetical protein CRG98_026293 [Punica granatum]